MKLFESVGAFITFLVCCNFSLGAFNQEINLEHSKYVLLGLNETVKLSIQHDVSDLVFAVAQDFDDQLIVGEFSVVEQVSALYSERGLKQIEGTALNNQNETSINSTELTVVCPLTDITIGPVRYSQGDGWDSVGKDVLVVPSLRSVQMIITTDYSGSEQCSGQWIHYQGSEYFLSDGKSATKTEAQDNCTSMGSVLVTITDTSHMDVLDAIANHYRSDNYKAWVMDSPEENRFQVVDTDPQAEFVCMRDSILKGFTVKEKHSQTSSFELNSTFLTQFQQSGQYELEVTSPFYEDLGITDIKGFLNLTVVPELNLPIEIQLPTSQNKNYALINREISFEADLITQDQTNLEYHWIITNVETGTQIENIIRLDQYFNFTFPSADTYNVTVMVSNKISEVSTSITLKVICAVKSLRLVPIRYRVTPTVDWTVTNSSEVLVPVANDVQSIMAVEYEDVPGNDFCKGTWLQYNGREYSLSAEKTTFASADPICQAGKASLAKVTDPDVWKMLGHGIEFKFGADTDTWLKIGSLTGQHFHTSDTADPLSNYQFVCERESVMTDFTMIEASALITNQNTTVGTFNMQFPTAGDYQMEFHSLLQHEAGNTIYGFQNLTAVPLLAEPLTINVSENNVLIKKSIGFEAVLNIQDQKDVQYHWIIMDMETSTEIENIVTLNKYLNFTFPEVNTYKISVTTSNSFSSVSESIMLKAHCTAKSLSFAPIRYRLAQTDEWTIANSSQVLVPVANDVQLVVVVEYTGSAKCQGTWLQYGGVEYSLSDQTFNKVAVDAICQGGGASLATITDESVLTMVHHASEFLFGLSEIRTLLHIDSEPLTNDHFRTDTSADLASKYHLICERESFMTNFTLTDMSSEISSTLSTTSGTFDVQLPVVGVFEFKIQSLLQQEVYGFQNLTVIPLLEPPLNITQSANQTMIENEITFEAIFDSQGQPDLLYHWIISDIDSNTEVHNTATSDKHLSYTFTDAGSYKITVTIYNTISDISGSTMVTVRCSIEEAEFGPVRYLSAASQWSVVDMNEPIVPVSVDTQTLIRVKYSNTSKCSGYWTQYEGQEFQILQIPLSKTLAISSCQKKGGQLAKIVNAEMSDMLHATVSHYHPSTGQKFWIDSPPSGGTSDILVTVDGGEELSFICQRQSQLSQWTTQESASLLTTQNLTQTFVLQFTQIGHHQLDAYSPIQKSLGIDIGARLNITVVKILLQPAIVQANVSSALVGQPIEFECQHNTEDQPSLFYYWEVTDKLSGQTHSTWNSTINDNFFTQSQLERGEYTVKATVDNLLNQLTNKTTVKIHCELKKATIAPVRYRFAAELPWNEVEHSMIPVNADTQIGINVEYAGSDKCNGQWLQYRGKEYHINSDAVVKYIDANSSCEQKGGQLANIAEEDTLNLVEASIPSSPSKYWAKSLLSSLSSDLLVTVDSGEQFNYICERESDVALWNVDEKNGKISEQQLPQTFVVKFPNTGMHNLTVHSPIQVSLGINITAVYDVMVVPLLEGPLTVESNVSKAVIDQPVEFKIMPDADIHALLEYEWNITDMVTGQSVYAGMGSSTLETSLPERGIYNITAIGENNQTWTLLTVYCTAIKAQFGPVKFATEVTDQWKSFDFAYPYIPQAMDTQMIVIVEYYGSVKCAGNWIQYKEHEFFISADAKPHAEAKTDCVDRGATLPTISDTKILSLLQSSLTHYYPMDESEVWVGAINGGLDGGVFVSEVNGDSKRYICQRITNLDQWTFLEETDLSPEQNLTNDQEFTLQFAQTGLHKMTAYSPLHASLKMDIVASLDFTVVPLLHLPLDVELGTDFPLAGELVGLEAKHDVTDQIQLEYNWTLLDLPTGEVFPLDFTTNTINYNFPTSGTFNLSVTVQNPISQISTWTTVHVNCPISSAQITPVRYRLDPAEPWIKVDIDQAIVPAEKDTQLIIQIEYSGTAECSGQWIQYKNNEYYITSGTTVDYATAEDACSDKKSDLASLEENTLDLLLAVIGSDSNTYWIKNLTSGLPSDVMKSSGDTGSHHYICQRQSDDTTWTVTEQLGLVVPVDLTNDFVMQFTEVGEHKLKAESTLRIPHGLAAPAVRNLTVVKLLDPPIVLETNVTAAITDQTVQFEAVHNKTGNDLVTYQWTITDLETNEIIYMWNGTSVLEKSFLKPGQFEINVTVDNTVNKISASTMIEIYCGINNANFKLVRYRLPSSDDWIETELLNSTVTASDTPNVQMIVNVQYSGSGKCSDNWFQYRSKEYRLSDDAKDRTDAQTHCGDLGAELANVVDEPLQDLLTVVASGEQYWVGSGLSNEQLLISNTVESKKFICERQSDLTVWTFGVGTLSLPIQAPINLTNEFMHHFAEVSENPIPVYAESPLQKSLGVEITANLPVIVIEFVETTSMAETERPTTVETTLDTTTELETTAHPSTSTSTTAEAESTMLTTESTTSTIAEPESTTLTTAEPESTTSTAAEPESTTSTAAEPESTTSTTEEPESTTSTTGEPESTTLTTAEPESTTSTAAEAESTTSTAAEPESTTSITEEPSTTSTTGEPESTTLTTESTTTTLAEPESTTLTTAEPESTTSTAAEPESTTSTEAERESTTSTTEEPELTTSTTGEPKSTTLTTAEAESTTSTTEEPESTTSTTGEPKSTTLTTAEAESTTSTAAEPESTTSTSEEPESTTSTTGEPESTTLTAAEPESTTSTDSEPESTTSTASEPESTTSTAAEPESTTSTTGEPESTTSTTGKPESTTSTTAEPKSTISITAEPESMTSTTAGPESTTSTAAEPESTTSTTEEPESTTSTTGEPESTASTTAEPESTTSTTAEPESTTSTTAKPESTMSTTPEPESTTSTTSEPESTTSTTGEPDSTTSTTAKPESTTSTTGKPESTTSTTAKPESTASITGEPESMTSTTAEPESTTSTTVEPESTMSTTAEPELTTSTTAEPESTMLTTGEPESTTSTTGEPGSTTSTTGEPESTTSTTAKPESTTSTTSIPESTTSTTVQPESTTSTTTLHEGTTSAGSTSLEEMATEAMEKETTTEMVGKENTVDVMGTETTKNAKEKEATTEAIEIQTTAEMEKVTTTEAIEKENTTKMEIETTTEAIENETTTEVQKKTTMEAIEKETTTEVEKETTTKMEIETTTEAIEKETTTEVDKETTIEAVEKETTTEVEKKTTADEGKETTIEAVEKETTIKVEKETTAEMNFETTTEAIEKETDAIEKESTTDAFEKLATTELENETTMKAIEKETTTEAIEKETTEVEKETTIEKETTTKVEKETTAEMEIENTTEAIEKETTTEAIEKESTTDAFEKLATTELENETTMKAIETETTTEVEKKTTADEGKETTIEVAEKETTTEVEKETTAEMEIENTTEAIEKETITEAIGKESTTDAFEKVATTESIEKGTTTEAIEKESTTDAFEKLATTELENEKAIEKETTTEVEKKTTADEGKETTIEAVEKETTIKVEKETTAEMNFETTTEAIEKETDAIEKESTTDAFEKLATTELENETTMKAIEKETTTEAIEKETTEVEKETTIEKETTTKVEKETTAEMEIENTTEAIEKETTTEAIEKESTTDAFEKLATTELENETTMKAIETETTTEVEKKTTADDGKETTIEVAEKETTIEVEKETTAEMKFETTTEAIEKETITDAIEKESTTDALQKLATTESIEKETTSESIEKETTTESIEKDTTTESIEKEKTTESIDKETATELKNETTTEAIEKETTMEGIKMESEHTTDITAQGTEIFTYTTSAVIQEEPTTETKEWETTLVSPTSSTESVLLTSPSMSSEKTETELTQQETSTETPEVVSKTKAETASTSSHTVSLDKSTKKATTATETNVIPTETKTTVGTTIETLAAVEISSTSVPLIYEEAIFEANLDMTDKSKLQYNWTITDSRTGEQLYKVSLGKAEMKYTFNETGSYRVSVVVDNGLSTQSNEKNYEVSPPCRKPQIEFVSTSSDAANPTKVYLSDSIEVESHLTIDCNYTSESTNEWFVQKFPLIPESNPIAIDIEDNKKFNQKILMFPPRTLEAGNYQFCLRSTLDKTAFPPEEHIMEEKCAFLKVVPSGITAKILPNNEELVNRGTDQDLRLNPLLYSMDPNIKTGEDKKFTNFTWSCRSVNSPQFIEATRKGSCFTKDPSSLPWFSGKVDIKTLGSYFKSGSYDLKVLVERVYEAPEFQTVTLQSEDYIHLNVVEYSVPVLEINCEPECPSIDGNSILSNGFAYSIVSGCPKCESGQFGETAITAKLKNGTEVPVDQSVTQSDNEVLIDAENIFKLLPNVIEITVSNELILPDGKEQLSEKFKVNQPPYGGTCTADPVNGVKAIETSIELKCTDWKDEHGVANYFFYRITKDKKVRYQISATGVTSINVPSGTHTFKVDISDSLGMVQKGVSIVTLTVEEPDMSKISITDFLKNSQNNSNVLTTVGAIMDSMGKSGDVSDDGQDVGLTVFSKVVQLEEVKKTINDYLESDAVSENLKEASRMLLDSAQQDPGQLSDLVALLSSGEFGNVSDADPKEVTKAVNGMIQSGNDAMAGVLEKVITAVADVPMTKGSDIIPVVDTVNNILQYGYSASLTHGGQGANGKFEFVIGRIVADGINLAITKGKLSVNATETTIEGDLQAPAFSSTTEKVLSVKLLEGQSIDSIMQGDASGIFQIINGIWNLDNNKMTIDAKGATLKLFPKVATIIGLASFIYNDIDYTELGIQIWNATYSKSNDDLVLNGGTISAFSHLSTASMTVEVPANKNGQKILKSAGYLKVLKASVLVGTGTVVMLGPGRVYSRKSIIDGKVALVFEDCPIESSKGFLSSLTFAPIRLEYVPENFMDQLTTPGIKEVTLSPDSDSRVVLAAPNADPLPNYGQRKLYAEADFFPLDSVGVNELEDLLLGGEIVDFENGLMKTEGEIEYMLAQRTAISLDGSVMNFHNSDRNSFPFKKMYNAQLKFDIRSNGTHDHTVLTVSGQVLTGARDHYITELNTPNGGTIITELGDIYRKKQAQYVILSSNVQYVGIERPDSVNVIPQALVNQESQNVIKGVMNDATELLARDSDSMTMDEVQTASEGLLKMASALSAALQNSLDSPLQSDMKIAFDNEMENYDEVFLELPVDRTKMRYVEEYSEEEWALEAVKISQQKIAFGMAKQIEKTMGIIQDTLLKRITAGKSKCGSKAIQVEGGEVYVSYCNASSILSENPRCTDWEVRFPPTLADLGLQLLPSFMIATKLLCLASNPYAFADNAPVLINSGSLTVTIEDKNGTNLNITKTLKPIELRGIVTKTPPEPALTVGIPILRETEVIKLHAIKIKQYNRSVFIEIERTNEDPATLVAFLSFNSIPGPSSEEHEFTKTFGPKAVKYHWPIDMESLTNHSGFFYLGVGQLAQEGQTGVEYDGQIFIRNMTISYTARVISKGCYFYDDKRMVFNSEGLLPGGLAGDKRISCYTHHLTPFSAGLFIPTNKIDFDLVFSNFHFTRNITLKGRVFPLEDNKFQEKYLYLITLNTGYRIYSTCDSEVSFILTGTEDETDVREFKTPKIKTLPPTPDIQFFRWGTKDRFLMSTPRPLGDLSYLRIWHDNSGFENRASWYLSSVEFKDLQTDQTFKFLVNNWLATDHGDGATEQFVSVALRSESKRWSSILNIHDLMDHHLFFSAFTGGGCRARFQYSRMARMSTLLCTLLTMMVLTAFFLDSPDQISIGGTNIQKVGYFTIGTADIFYGAFVCILACPVPLILGYLFRNSRTSDRSYNIRNLPSQFERNRRPTYCEKVMFGPFSIWFRVLTWLLVFILVVVLSVFVLMYSSQFQEEKSRHWIITCIFNLVVSIIIVEPIKAILIVFIAEKTGVRVKNMVQPEELDEIQYKIMENGTIVWTENPGYTYIRPPELGLGDKEMNSMRDEKLYQVLRELIIYFVFLILITTLCYGSRIPMAYNYHHSIRETFAIDDQYLNIRTPEQFWDWSRNYLTRGLTVSWYNNKPAFGMRGFINDKHSRILGYGVIRQVRNRHDEGCRLHPMISHLFVHCNTYTELKREDNYPAYTPGWLTELNHELADQAQSEYKYRQAKELRGIPFWGRIDRYSAAGYVVQLNGTRKGLIAKFDQLQSEGWIDERTRAIFIEFSVYNANVNMFAITQLSIESPPVGALIPHVWIEPLRLLKYENNNALQILLAELSFCVIAVIYAIIQVYNIVTMGPREYFTHFWTWVEFLVSVMSVTSIGCYIARSVMVSKILAEFKETNGNVYIKLDYERMLDLYFLWLISGVLFLVTMKLLRILRFNKRIAILADTLSHASSTLMAFSVVFLIVMIAYACSLFFVLFKNFDEYSTFWGLIQTNFSAMMGKFDMENIFSASWLAPIIFMMFMLTMAILLLNMFITLFIFFYEEVREKALLQTNDYELLDHFQIKILKATKMAKPHDHPAKNFPDSRATRKCNAADKLTHKVDVLLDKFYRYYTNEDYKPFTAKDTQRKCIVAN